MLTNFQSETIIEKKKKIYAENNNLKVTSFLNYMGVEGIHNLFHFKDHPSFFFHPTFLTSS